jgi:hypothetical protein
VTGISFHPPPREALATVAHGIEESGMNARLRLAHPRWYLTTPTWAHLLRRAVALRPTKQGEAPGGERAATRAARRRRTDRIRIDAERHWSGLGPR